MKYNINYQQVRQECPGRMMILSQINKTRIAHINNTITFITQLTNLFLYLIRTAICVASLQKGPHVAKIKN